MHLKKERYTAVLLILSCITLNLLYWIPDNIYDDKIIYRYIGLVIYKGGVPYRDAFDNKPPLIFFLNAVTWLTSYRITWMIDTAVVLLATLLFYGLCKKNKLAWPWFLPLIFNLIIRNNLIAFGDGMTREYTAVFGLIFFCVLQGSYRYKDMILGSLFALSFWMQQDSVIMMMPLVLYAVFFQDNASDPLIRRICFQMGGFLLISLPIIGYFILNHSFSFLWQDTFLFNSRLQRQTNSFFSEFKLIKHALHETEMEMPFYTCLILGVAGVWLVRKRKALVVSCVAMLLLSFSAEFLTGRMNMGNGYMHYLLPLAASIPVLVFVVFTETGQPIFYDRYVQILTMFMLSLVLMMGTLRYISVQSWKQVAEPAYSKLPEISYLDKQHLADYQLYVLDDTYLIYLYNQYRILSPTRWNYHFFGASHVDWDKNPDLIHEIIQDLQKHKTTYILDCTGSWHYGDDKLFLPECRKFLQENYRVIITDSSKRMLWRIQ